LLVATMDTKLDDKINSPREMLGYQTSRAALPAATLALGVAGIPILHKSLASIESIKVISYDSYSGVIESYAQLLALTLRGHVSAKVTLDTHFHSHGESKYLSASMRAPKATNVLITSPWLLCTNHEPTMSFISQIRRDFMPVATVQLGLFVFAANKALDIQSVLQLKLLLKTKMLKIGVVGNFSPAQSFAAMLNRELDARIIGIPFDHERDAWRALNEQKIDLMFGGESTMVAALDEANFRILAASGDRPVVQSVPVPSITDIGANHPMFNSGECALVLTHANVSQPDSEEIRLHANKCLSGVLATQFFKAYPVQPTINNFARCTEVWDALVALEDPQFHQLNEIFG
jgi:tripartite-type tricarboxylate transporter receptor subunit TctC